MRLGSFGSKVTAQQYRALAAFRYELRRFLRYSEDLVRQRGLTPLQYQVLLQIKGYPGRERVAVGEMAERLQAKPNGASALVRRCEKLGLIKRRASARDRRIVCLMLTAKGTRVLEPLVRMHRDELRSSARRFPPPLLVQR